MPYCLDNIHLHFPHKFFSFFVHIPHLFFLLICIAHLIFYFKCFLIYFLYILHILFHFVFSFIFSFHCLFKRPNGLCFSIKHTIFPFVKVSDIFIVHSFVKFIQKKPDITALLPYTRLSDSQDLSVISYSIKYSGYSSIFFWRSLRNRPRCPVIKSSALTSFGIPIIM